MISASVVRPPKVATWLVGLFAPYENIESITGDLLEEFSNLASKLGIASARRWYWRQSAKTIVGLVSGGFGAAPLAIAGIVLGGLFLLNIGTSLPERAIVAVIRLRQHHVTPFYDSKSLATYLFWLKNGTLIGDLLIRLIIGCLVAVAAKGREMIAAMTLSLAAPTIFWLLLASHLLIDPTLLPTIIVHEFAASLMVVTGGVLVRETRLAVSRRSARASHIRQSPD